MLTKVLGAENGLLPWAKRTRVGRRNLLTTASNGSANGLQVISDRLADNFSILPGHHGSGDEDDGDGGGEDGADNGGAKAEADGSDGGALKSKTFAMFDRQREESAVSAGAHELWEGARGRSLSLSLARSVNQCCLSASLTPLCKASQTLI